MKGKKTGGRAAGTPNKSRAEIKELARDYSPAAIEQLARLGGLIKGKDGKPEGAAESQQTQAYCCSAILDRAYGKPAQPIASDPDNPFEGLMSWLDGRTRGVPSHRDSIEDRRTLAEHQGKVLNS